MGFLQVFGKKLTGVCLGPNPGKTAQDWVNGLKPWKGTLPELYSKVAGDVSACSGYVLSISPCATGSEAQSLCEGKIRQFYQEDFNRLSGLEQEAGEAKDSYLRCKMLGDCGAGTGTGLLNANIPKEIIIAAIVALIIILIIIF